ncbi:MAG TPA: acetate/propionate family kinase [Burkholderiales bacterium]|nr:acetate/propionate family kinase [Burkholderiales bacterium]
MSDAILVLNAGSSSIKYSVFVDNSAGPKLLLRGQLEGLYTAPRFEAKDAKGTLVSEHRWKEGEALGHDGAIAHLRSFLRERSASHRLIAVGHRVVHGGEDYAAPVRVTPEVMAKLEKYVSLAPLHQPHNLSPIKALLKSAPDTPQVACFDTGFHRSHSAVAQAFALPGEITERGVRRYGFHGLSYEYIASVLAQYDRRAAEGRTVVFHLGNGASMCAMKAGRSVASTMGFTAMDGLPMGTRPGNIDPGVVLYLMDEMKMDARAIENLLYKKSGLLGISGISSDMRTLLASDDPKAKFAVEVFIYRAGRELGSLAAALEGLDAIVFTAGIGEHAAPVRERICRAAAWLRVELDAAANAAGGPRISTESSKVSAWVIPTNEELMIARHTRALVGAA